MRRFWQWICNILRENTPDPQMERATLPRPLPAALRAQGLRSLLCPQLQILATPLATSRRTTQQHPSRLRVSEPADDWTLTTSQKVNVIAIAVLNDATVHIVQSETSVTNLEVFSGFLGRLRYSMPRCKDHTRYWHVVDVPNFTGCHCINKHEYIRVEKVGTYPATTTTTRSKDY